MSCVGGGSNSSECWGPRWRRRGTLSSPPPTDTQSDISEGGQKTSRKGDPGLKT